MTLPALTESKTQYDLEFRDTAFHGLIHNFAVSEDYQTAVTISRYGQYEILVYDDLEFSYVIWTGYTRGAPTVYYVEGTLYILHRDTVIKVTEPGVWQTYTFADPNEGARFLNAHPGENAYAVVQAGDRRYFLEKGNLVFSIGDSEGTFYVTDEGTRTLPSVVISVIMSLMFGVWLYRTFMDQYRQNHPEKD